MGIDLYNLVISAKLQKGGGGGDIEVDALNVTENGVYSASSGHAFDPVTVSVPQGVFPSGTSSITANGIYDITSFASVDVNVSGGGGGHDAEDGIIQKTISGVYENSRVTNIGSSAFNGCSALTTVNFTNATSIDSHAFNGCSALTTASFPNATSIGNNAFTGCNALTTASFPKVTSIGQGVFQNCKSLTTVSFPKVTSIGSNAFNNCNKLTTAIFLASTVGSIKANTFAATPMSNSTYTGSFGSIYVPASLVNSYKAATNWSEYAARITSYVE